MATLTVNAPDGATELFVLGSDFSLRLRPRRGTPHELPEGIYKVRATVGRTEWQRLVVLDPAANVTVDVPQIAFGSAAPLRNTNRTHESHQGAAGDIGMMPPRGAAAGLAPRAGGDAAAGLAVMARWWRPGAAGPSRPLGDPAAGVSLRTAGGGRPLVRIALDEARMDGGGTPGGPGHYRRSLARAGTAMPEGDWSYGDLGADRYTTFSARCRPGLYTLSLPDGEGVREQIVTVLPGWQLSVFLLYAVQGAPGAPGGPGARRLADLSLHYSRGRFDPEGETARLTDAARLALADERGVASQDFLHAATSDAENPLLGLLGAHLLLVLKDRARLAGKSGVARPATFHQERFDRIVGAVARVFGAGHPDIRALLTQTTGFVADPRPLRTPPMLRPSWDRLLAQSCRTPGIIGPRLWRRTMRRSGAPPFLAWRMPQPRGARLGRIEGDIAGRILQDLRADPEAERAAGSSRQTGEEAETLLRFKARMVAMLGVPRSVVDMAVPGPPRDP